MGIDDRVESAADKLKGTVKEAAGKLTDNDKLEAEGKADQAKGKLKDAVEDVKDAFKKD
ncbi:CsbD family protein [Arthrobacter sp. 35W]|uniref:CsbD family protein n=1 Tax=Arthrobacter sp. 35W TaxID=1132441 RepID=UPI0004296E2F|nr:CsbD family protein [Arthrobacter sp. 35W]